MKNTTHFKNSHFKQIHLVNPSCKGTNYPNSVKIGLKIQFRVADTCKASSVLFVFAGNCILCCQRLWGVPRNCQSGYLSTGPPQWSVRYSSEYQTLPSGDSCRKPLHLEVTPGLALLPEGIPKQSMVHFSGKEATRHIHHAPIFIFQFMDCTPSVFYSSIKHSFIVACSGLLSHPLWSSRWLNILFQIKKNKNSNLSSTIDEISPVPTRRTKINWNITWRVAW